MTDPSDAWQRVAADDTDPAALRRVVAALSRPGRGAMSLLRDAARLADAHPDWSSDRLLTAAAPEPGPDDLRRADAAATRWDSLDVRAALAGDAAYPECLAAGWPTTAGPLLLAWRGADGGVGDRPAVAIVGARRATGYGTGVAAWLAEAAARAGALVVSGGAAGIDAAAHGAALDQTGGTAVVLGCGHAVGYPAAHAAPGGLFERILSHDGLVLSEVLPDTRPSPGLVRARNRIVAALADVVVVVEGGERSGSLITAGAAADRGVAVLAVPGDVRAPGSVAPHRLLAEGAMPCTSPTDLLEALGEAAPAQPTLSGDGPRRAPVTTLPDPVHAELVRRWPRTARVDDLAAACDLPAASLLAVVTRARVAGELAESAEGIRLVRAPS